ncbi:MAG: hypothetical protein ABI706_05690 [Ilumatobacteraceae bacterium]
MQDVGEVAVQMRERLAGDLRVGGSCFTVSEGDGSARSGECLIRRPQQLAN